MDEWGIRYTGLRYAWRDDFGWHINDITPKDHSIDENMNLVFSLTIDKQNLPHVAYAYSYMPVKYAYFDGSQWVTESNTGTVVTLPISLYLKLDSYGNPHISYSNYSESYGTLNLNYATKDGSGRWTDNQLINSGPAFSELVSDKDDNFYVAATNYDVLTAGDNIYKLNNDGTMTVVCPLPLQMPANAILSLNIDSSGYPRVTLYPGLSYWQWTGFEWLTSSVDGNVSSNNAMSGFDMNGHPIVGYLDNYNNFNYARLE